jgi:hypothetical protein
MEKKEVAIHIVDDTPDSTSSADVDREEMKWESREEKYLDSIHKQCLDLSEQHNNASKKAKTKFGACSIPVIIIPIVMGSVNQYLPAGYEYINSTGMMLTGIISGINAFFNYGKKTTQHNEYAGRYAELAGYISAELIKPKRHRVALDVFLERTNQRWSSLNSSAPML